MARLWFPLLCLWLIPPGDSTSASFDTSTFHISKCCRSIKRSIRANEELDRRSNENIHAVFVPTAARCCDTAVTSLCWRLTSSCRLPAEILDKIVSYLDASALFTVSFTDKFLCRLANEKWVSRGKVSISAMAERDGHLLSPPVAAALHGPRCTRQSSARIERRSRRVWMSSSWLCRRPQRWCRTSHWDAGRWCTSGPWLRVTQTSGKGIFEQSATTQDCPVKQSASYGKSQNKRPLVDR